MTQAQVKQTTTGAACVVAGVILLGNAFDLRDVWRAWPLVFFIVGLPRLLAPESADDRWSGVSLVATGTVFLLHTMSIFRLRDSWPLFLVGFGLSLMLRPQTPTARKEG